MEREIKLIEEIVSKAGKVTSEATAIFASCYKMSLRRFQDACDRGMGKYYSSIHENKAI